MIHAGAGHVLNLSTDLFEKVMRERKMMSLASTAGAWKIIFKGSKYSAKHFSGYRACLCGGNKHHLGAIVCRVSRAIQH